MARLYANENFPLPVVKILRELGHDVLTSHESGRANLAIPDSDVLAFAIGQSRIVLTLNRKHFIYLHNDNQQHPGIIVCTFDPDWAALAGRIHAMCQEYPVMSGQLVRINRPSK